MAATRDLSKPIAGLVFVLGWGIGITLWSLAHLAPDATIGGLIVDVGILSVSLGFAAPFIKTQRWMVNAALLALGGLVLFVFGHFVHITVLVYMLRLLAPLLALLTPLYRLLDFRIFA
ncbi:MAG: hypothetical protein JWM49_1197 [Microbacteriaceae bacterium]|jgi:uncharacterized membrane protein|nr:hypothetical protein [Microbacteriaceae bacterium]